MPLHARRFPQRSRNVRVSVGHGIFDRSRPLLDLPERQMPMPFDVSRGGRMGMWIGEMMRAAADRAGHARKSRPAAAGWRIGMGVLARVMMMRNVAPTHSH